MIIQITTTDETLINDMLEISSNRFDFAELEITEDNDKLNYWIKSMIKDRVDDLRRQKATSQVEFTKVNGEIT